MKWNIALYVWETELREFAKVENNYISAKKNSQRLKSINAQVRQQTWKTFKKIFSKMKAKGCESLRCNKNMTSFVFSRMLKNCLGCG